jgi:hypothetical protein
MNVEHVEVLVEERSSEAALSILLPRILGQVTFALHPHQGKSDLLAKLPGRLRGYAAWLPASWRVLVLVDRDDDNCAKLKTRLERIAKDSKLRTRSIDEKGWALVNRIAIEELEAWFFGDWKAVREAYPKVPASIPSQTKFRNPDEISGGTCEALERVLQRAGYFSGGLRKIEFARTVAQKMVPTRNQSPSFRAFLSALTDLA